MVGGPAQFFTGYRGKDITRIRKKQWRKKKFTKGVIGYDTNALYLYCSGDVMPCRKDTLVVKGKPFDQKRIEKCFKDVLEENVFEFAHADIEVFDELYNKFIEMVPVFVVQEISDCNIPEGMKIYKKKSGRKTIKRTKMLLGVIRA